MLHFSPNERRPWYVDTVVLFNTGWNRKRSGNWPRQIFVNACEFLVPITPSSLPFYLFGRISYHLESKFFCFDNKQLPRPSSKSMNGNPRDHSNNNNIPHHANNNNDNSVPLIDMEQKLLKHIEIDEGYVFLKARLNSTDSVGSSSLASNSFF